MTKQKNKMFTVKARILLITMVPVVVIGIAVLVAGIIFMKAGMEEEILKGLLSSAYAYSNTGIANMDREVGDNEIESTLKTQTGYDYTWFDGDTRKNSSLGSSVIGTQAASTVITEVIGCKHTFTSTKTQVVGQDYFVAYVPIQDKDGKVISMAFTGVPRASVQAQIRKSVIVMLIIAIVLLVITTIVALKASTGISRAVGSMESSITGLSQGDFIKSEDYLDRSDEIGHALNSTNSLIDKLTTVVHDIRDVSMTVSTQSKDLTGTSNQISETTDGVSMAVQQMAKGASEQAEVIQTATSNIAELSEAIKDVATNAERLAGTASDMDNASKSSKDALNQLSKNMSAMETSVDSITKTMNVTSQAVQEVNKKVDGIASIASQTNLLALNASIEAARAGDAGRGFSVVAEEIGKLATQSATTAEEIRKEMNNLLKHSNEAIQETNEIADIGKNVSKVLHDTVSTINELISNVAATVDGVNNISSLTERCDKSKLVIVDVMSSLSAISEENAASTEETAASMQELNTTVSLLAEASIELQKVAEKLDEELKFFKI